MLDELKTLKKNIDEQGRATRKDIVTALYLIKIAKVDRETEITELIKDVYDNEEVEHILSDLDSYAI